MRNGSYEEDRVQCTAERQDGKRCTQIGTHSNGGGVLCDRHHQQKMKPVLRVVGIVIEPWKLSIFKKHLDAAGLNHTQRPGPVPGTILLTVRCESPIAIKPIIEAAHKEAGGE